MIEGVTTLVGKKSGRTVAVIGGVHGNEPCGIRAVRGFLETGKIERGIVHFIIGNPRAIEKEVRYIDMNLNRAFCDGTGLTTKELASYERGRAEELMPILDTCEATLDIHSSLNRGSKQFLICESKAFPFAAQLPFTLVSDGWDALEPGTTDYYMNRRGAFGICAECGYHGDGGTARKAEEALQEFLYCMGAIEGASVPRPRKQRHVHTFLIHVTRTDFVPTRVFDDFERLAEGEFIGTDGGARIVAPSECLIIFAHSRKNPGEEAFLLGRETGS